MVAFVILFMTLLGAAVFSHGSVAIQSKKESSEDCQKGSTKILRSNLERKNADAHHRLAEGGKWDWGWWSWMRSAATSPPVTMPSCAMEILDRIKPPQNSDIKTSVGLDALYILHYPKLKERRATAERQLADAGLQHAAFWMTQLNKEDITPSVKSCMVASDFGPALNLAFKHVWAYYHTWKNQYQHVLVLEDDFDFIVPDIGAALRQLVADVPADYTTVHVSTCLSLQANGSPSIGNHLYGPGRGSRCTGGYFISKRGAELMLGHIFGELHGITLPSDWQQDGVVNTGGYWYDPPMMKQSSEGHSPSYQSSLASIMSWGHLTTDAHTMLVDAGVSEGKNHTNHGRLSQVVVASHGVVTSNV